MILMVYYLCTLHQRSDIEAPSLTPLTQPYPNDFVMKGRRDIAKAGMDTLAGISMLSRRKRKAR